MSEIEVSPNNESFYKWDDMTEIFKNFFTLEFPDSEFYIRYNKNYGVFDLTLFDSFIIKQNQDDLKYYYEFTNKDGKITTKDIDFDFYHVFDTFYPIHSKKINIYIKKDSESNIFSEGTFYELLLVDRKY